MGQRAVDKMSQQAGGQFEFAEKVNGLLTK